MNKNMSTQQDRKLHGFLMRLATLRPASWLSLFAKALSLQSLVNISVSCGASYFSPTFYIRPTEEAVEAAVRITGDVLR